MDLTTEDENASSATTLRDEAFEFTAPQWYDFSVGETDEEKQQSELWFESSPSYAPSPSIPKIKPRRSFKVENMRNFSVEEEEEEGKSLKVKESSEAVAMEISLNLTKKEEEGTSKSSHKHEEDYNNYTSTDVQEHLSVIDQTDNKENIPPFQTKAYTPKLAMTSSKNHQASKKNLSVLMPKIQLQSSQAKTTNQTIIKRETNVKKFVGALNLVQGNQAIKMQKLDEGKSRQHNNLRRHLTEPKIPLLQTMLRARPSNVKSSTEIEQEETEKVPKFKAITLNKKIFESKGEMGIFCSTKKQVTIPQEFHFMTDEKSSHPNSVIDLFDKLSLDSEDKPPLQRNTTPNPFLLRTEERGAMKVKKYVTKLMHKRIEDKRVRVPKATPYPYTTDYPVVPPKPEPRQCTKQEPFQLESLARHEEAMQRGMEARMIVEREETHRRVFRAQPVIKVDPIPVPEKVLKPFTEFQEFNLHVNRRAVEREDFDRRIKEKELMYKRYREETEATKTVDEERALKRLRRTMVPQARAVPNFNNPFLPQKSKKETTKPKSPGFRVTRRIEWRTMLSSST